jgi:catechol 2,3-dioxygenase-like lactoylglutathione lyase family enzyme
MTIALDHTIVPAHDKERSARFFADMFGLQVDHMGPFAAVQVNDALTLDFATMPRFEPHHLAFHVSEAEFDTIFGRIQAAHLPFSADPFHQLPGQINHRHGGRGVYFRDPDGHNLELLTRRAA